MHTQNGQTRPYKVVNVCYLIMLIFYMGRRLGKRLLSEFYIHIEFYSIILKLLKIHMCVFVFAYVLLFILLLFSMSSY